MAKHEPAALRRTQLLDAALACFAEHGYHLARIDDIAKHAGLSKGAFYHHFASKEEVFNAVFDRFNEEFQQALGSLAGHNLPQVLLSYGETIVRTLTQDRRLVGAWSEFFGHPASRERMALLYQQIRMELGKVLGNNGDGIATAALLVGAIEGLVLQGLVDEEFDALEAWQQAAPTLLQAL